MRPSHKTIRWSVPDAAAASPRQGAVRPVSAAHPSQIVTSLCSFKRFNEV